MRRRLNTPLSFVSFVLFVAIKTSPRVSVKNHDTLDNLVIFPEKIANLQTS
jgi:hypothetical protein